MTIPYSNRLIQRHDPAITPYTHDAVLTATPDAVFRPHSIAEIQEMVAYCNAQKIPLTVSAARTSMTGGPVCDRGIVLSLEGLTQILELNEEAATITVQPGVILGDLQRYAEERDFFYPPSPTSRNECTIGATIATNATGDTTYKYGTTRRYVRALTLVMADGSLKTVQRVGTPPTEFKNTAGYFLHGEEIDYFIGSEGTLGVIVSAELQLLRGVPSFFTLVMPFPSNTSALEFIVTPHTTISPRTMEYIDAQTLAIMEAAAGFPKLPANTQAIVICQQEYDADALDKIEDWYAVLQTTYTQLGTTTLQDGIILAQTLAEQNKVAAWRHHIPATVSEQHVNLQKMGGGKVGTDWWVPLPRMLEMMVWAYSESDKLNIPYYAFAHLGNGHPHFNYMTRNPEEKVRAQDFVVNSCKKAVALGGGVAGEHGLGKLKRNLLPIQYPTHIIDEMRALKKQYDPGGILGVGNIFK